MAGPVMVPKGTVYQSAFKPRTSFLAQSFEGNLGYRLHRREVECFHSVDPFLWPEEQDFIDEDLDCMTPKRPASVPEHIYKHEKFNAAYQQRLRAQNHEIDRQARSKKKPSSQHLTNGIDELSLPLEEMGLVENSHSNVRPVTAQSIDKEVQTSERLQPTKKVKSVAVSTNGHLKYNKDKVNKAISPGSVESSSPLNTNVNCSQLNQVPKPKKSENKPGYKKPIPKPRPISAPLGRPVKKVAPPKDEKAPFLAYGFYDDERETGRKKTHNVRASADVYPAALRAWRRHQVEIEQHEKEQEEAPMRQKRKRALFNDIFGHENPVWDTEYRNKFAAYRNSEYNNNLQKRLNPKRVHELYSPR